MKNNLPSNRKFGSAISLALLLFTLSSYTQNIISIKLIVLFCLTVFFFILTLLNSKILTPLNYAWFFLGEWLGKISSPIVLGIIFFIIITPIGLLSRLFRRDELKLKRKNFHTYWSDPIGSSSDSKSFKNQF